MPLDPQAKVFLEKIASMPHPPDVSVEEARRALSALLAPSAPTPTPAPLGHVEDRVIKGGDQQDMRVRLYVPEGAGPFPIITWVHGGSFTRGSLDLFDAARRTYAKASRCIVVAVDQRLSPEAQFPAPLEDAYAAAVWTAEHAGEFGGDPSRLGIGGDSSGGNIAAVVAQLALERGGPKFAVQVLFEPFLDATCSSPSIDELAEDYFPTRRQMAWAIEQYAPGVPLEDPRISPARKADLRGLPPAALVTMEYDPLRDEGERYVVRLREAGVPVYCARIDGMLHHFPGPRAMGVLASLTRQALDHERN
jgi:acetyl esterase